MPHRINSRRIKGGQSTMASMIFDLMHRPATVAEMVETYGGSERSIRYYIQIIRNAGFRLVIDRKTSTYYIELNA